VLPLGITAAIATLLRPLNDPSSTKVDSGLSLLTIQDSSEVEVVHRVINSGAESNSTSAPLR
jgi:hypothetical protein